MRSLSASTSCRHRQSSYRTYVRSYWTSYIPHIVYGRKHARVNLKRYPLCSTWQPRIRCLFTWRAHLSEFCNSKSSSSVLPYSHVVAPPRIYLIDFYRSCLRPQILSLGTRVAEVTFSKFSGVVASSLLALTPLSTRCFLCLCFFFLLSIVFSRQSQCKCGKSCSMVVSCILLLHLCCGLDLERITNYEKKNGKFSYKIYLPSVCSC